MAPATNESRFSHLDREMYEFSEIAYMLNLNIRTIRSYRKKDSEKYPDRKLLVAKMSRGVYRVTRQDLIMFLEEMYGG